MPCVHHCSTSNMYRLEYAGPKPVPGSGHGKHSGWKRSKLSTLGLCNTSLVSVSVTDAKDCLGPHLQ